MTVLPAGEAPILFRSTLANAEFKPVAAPDLSDRGRAVNRVADAVHRMNEAIQRAVNAGVSVELVRVSRHR